MLKETFVLLLRLGSIIFLDDLRANIKNVRMAGLRAAIQTQDLQTATFSKRRSWHEAIVSCHEVICMHFQRRTIGVLGFVSRRGLGVFLLTAASGAAVGPTDLLSGGCGWLFHCGWGGRGVGLAVPLSLVPRSGNEWSYASILQYAFVAWCSLKKTQNNFTWRNNRIITDSHPPD
jgi:hypothetical protein